MVFKERKPIRQQTLIAAFVYFVCIFERACDDEFSSSKPGCCLSIIEAPTFCDQSVF